jgi:hypothetical protein
MHHVCYGLVLGYLEQLEHNDDATDCLVTMQMGAAPVVRKAALITLCALSVALWRLHKEKMLSAVVLPVKVKVQVICVLRLDAWTFVSYLKCCCLPFDDVHVL